jgi:hypothetical protein
MSGSVATLLLRSSTQRYTVEIDRATRALSVATGADDAIAGTSPA